MVYDLLRLFSVGYDASILRAYEQCAVREVIVEGVHIDRFMLHAFEGSDIYHLPLHRSPIYSTFGTDVECGVVDQALM